MDDRVELMAATSGTSARRQVCSGPAAAVVKHAGLFPPVFSQSASTGACVEEHHVTRLPASAWGREA